jgi:hypothetical protein
MEPFCMPMKYSKSKTIDRQIIAEQNKSILTPKNNVVTHGVK